MVKNGSFEGIKISNSDNIIPAKACVLTTGTFLNGKISIGDQNHQGGRFLRKSENEWEPPVHKISAMFNEFDIERSNF